MFDIENAIKKWRQQMQAAGVTDKAVLAELESHLRADTGALVAQGKTEADAFALAAARLGSASDVQIEFDKLGRSRCWPVTVSWIIWAALSLLQGVWLVFEGRWGFFAGLQFFSIMAGLLAAFMAGVLGVFYVGSQIGQEFPPTWRQLLPRAIAQFTHVALGLVLVALVLGMAWVHAHPAQFARSGRYPYAVGTWCLFIWLTAVVTWQRLGNPGAQTRILAAIAGNIVVLLSSFPFAAMQFAHGSGLAEHWLLLTIVGLHAALITVVLLQRAEPSSRSA